MHAFRTRLAELAEMGAKSEGNLDSQNWLTFCECVCVCSIDVVIFRSHKITLEYLPETRRSNVTMKQVNE